MKNFRSFIQEESETPDEVSKLRDQVIPHLENKQLANYYGNSGLENWDELHHHTESIKELSKILSDPNIQEDHFAQVMNHRVPYQKYIERETSRLPAHEHLVPIHSLIPEIFKELPLERAQNFIDSIPTEEFIRGHMDPHRDEYSDVQYGRRKLYLDMLEHKDHTPETLIRAITGAHLRKIPVSYIRERVFEHGNIGTKTKIVTDEVLKHLGKISDFEKMESIFRYEPFTNIPAPSPHNY